MAFSYQIYTSYGTKKSQIKQLFGRNSILNNFIKRENLNYRGLFVDKGSGYGSG